MNNNPYLLKSSTISKTLEKQDLSNNLLNILLDLLEPTIPTLLSYPPVPSITKTGNPSETLNPLDLLNAPVPDKDVPEDVPMDKTSYNVLVLLKPPVPHVSSLKP